MAGPLSSVQFTANLDVNKQTCPCHLYANDAQVYISGDKNDVVENNEILNYDLRELVNFSVHHGLLSKSAIVLLRSKL